MSALLPIVLSVLFLCLLQPTQNWSAKRVAALAASLVWGGTAFGIALAAQSALFPTLNMIIVRLGLTPLVEEILKASPFLLPLVRCRLTSPVRGIVYGFAIGMGFALAESLYFASLTPDYALAVSVTRVFSTNLMHGTGTALMGLALAMRDYKWQLIALAWAVGLHIVFNALNFHLSGDSRLLVLVSMGIGCAFGLQVLINRLMTR